MKISKSKFEKNWKYFFLFLLMAFSGNPLFMENKLLFPIFGLFFLFFCFAKSINFGKKRFVILLLYCLFTLCIFFLQKVVLNLISYLGTFNMLFKILLGGLIIMYVGFDFKKIYFNITYFICCVSLIFFFINLIGFEVPGIVIDEGTRSSLIFYTQPKLSSLNEGVRNSGMFWEPGAFSGFILLLPLFYLQNLRLLLKNKKKILIILLAIISTLSTTGYIVLLLIVLFYLFTQSRKKIFIYFLSPIIFLIITLLFINVDFLGKKIEHQFNNSQNLNTKKNFSPDRFGALMFDLHYIKKHPFVGNGLLEETRFSDHLYLRKTLGKDVFNSRGNGFSNFIATMGIPFFLFILYLIYRLYPWKKSVKLFYIFIIIVLIQGEQFFNTPLFLVLPFIKFKTEQ